MPFYYNPRILIVLVLIYITLVSVLIWLGWLVASWLEVVLGKRIGKWIKYLIMLIVIPYTFMVSIIGSAYVFQILFWETLPEWIWGIKEDTSKYNKK